MSKTNNQSFINHRVRYNGRKINIFDRINKIKSDLKELMPEVEEDRFLSMASHVRNFYYGNLHYGRRDKPENKKRKRELTPNEKILLDYFMKNSINPSTAYRWFVACRIPSDIKEKLAHGQVSFKKAFEIADNRKKSKMSNTGLLMIEEINNVVRSL
ncbi:hypothetical protein K8R33_00545 [archaeon]|nr:hypothetical protein [archaeon]